MSLGVERMRGRIRQHAVSGRSPCPVPPHCLRPALRDSQSPGALPGAAAVMEISEAKPGSCDGAASPVPRHEGRNQRRTAPPRPPSAPCGYGGRSGCDGNQKSEAPRTRMGRGRVTSPFIPDKPTPYPRGNAAGGEGGNRWFCITTPKPSPHPHASAFSTGFPPFFRSLRRNNRAFIPISRSHSTGTMNSVRNVAVPRPVTNVDAMVPQTRE